MSARADERDTAAGVLERQAWSRLTVSRREFLSKAASLAHELGTPALLVGGAVRDLLTGGLPRQLDLLIEGNGLRFARETGRREGARVIVHDRFLTAAIELPSGESVDIASTRTESYPTPAALPVIRPADLDADLGRRDFTINAMALPLTSGGFGRLIDPFGGVEDLRAGLMRVLHAGSFIDDPTRAFRCARLSTRLGFRAEAGTAGLMAAAVEAGAMGRLSGFRLRRELELMAAEQPLATGARALDAAGLLGSVHEGLHLDAGGLERLRRADGLLPACAGPGPAADGLVLMLGLLLAPKIQGEDGPEASGDGPHGIMAASLADRLDLRGRRGKALEAIVREAPRLASELAGRVEPGSAIHARLRRLDPLLVLAAGAVEPAPVSTIEDWFGRLSVIATTLGGKDLAALGVPQGPRQGAIRRAVLTALLDGRISGREEELDLARSLAGEPDQGGPWRERRRRR